MSLRVTPMMYGDIASMTVQSEQVGVNKLVGTQYDEWLLKGGPAFTVRAEGEVIGCLGMVEQWEGRALVWAVLSEDARKHLLALTRVARAYLYTSPFRRIEAAVDAHFRMGCRWAHLLGFELETPRPMPNYFANGNSAYLYAHVARST